jgi:hypothetical protein
MSADGQDDGIESGESGSYHSEMIIIRNNDPDGEEKLRAFHERMRARIGDEAFEQHMRTKELMKHPRELTHYQKTRLRDALAPVMRDLEVSGQAPPLIREESREDLDDDAICAWIEGPDGTGQGIRMWLNGSAGSLEPEIRDDEAVWLCPRDGETVAAVGSLPSRRRRRRKTR